MASPSRIATLIGLAVGTVLAFSLTAHAAEREEFHKTVPLAANGAVALRNVNGTITVTTWDRNEVQIDAVKSAENREELSRVTIDVTGGSSLVDIRAKYPENTDNSAKVNFTLRVPRSARIDKIENINGDVEIRGVNADVRANVVNGKVFVDGTSGAIKLNAVNGELRATAKQSKQAELECVNCRIELTLPSDANAHVVAGSLHGDIKSDFNLPVQHTRFVGSNSVDANIGSGAASVKLQTVNGEIQIRRASDGKQMSPVNSLLKPDKASYY